MWNSPEVPVKEQFSGQLSGKVTAEKSNFAQTCSLLSHFLKENRKFGDLTGKLEAKEKSENSCEASSQSGGVSSNMKSMDLLPQFASSIEDVTNKIDLRKKATGEPETSQMTIFYGGQVLVFDDFPAEKVKEVMQLANKGSSVLGTDHNVNPSSFVASCSNFVSTSKINSTQEQPQTQPRVLGSDLPIARRNSLHRFFEKRKDRATARAPYQVNNPSTPLLKPKEDQSSNQFELKL